MKRLLIDIETNLKHDTIWCAVTQDIDTGEVIVHTTPQRLKSVIKSYDIIVGHNIIGFDAPILREVWGIRIRTTQVHDTLVMSRLYNPILEGGHSLKNWGKILGNDKINFDAEDFDGGLTDDMIKYCKQDVALNVEVYKTLLEQLSTWGDYEKALQLEHEVAIHITRQERNGFNFDLEKATVLQAEVADRMAVITDELQAVFPPIVEERWSEKTGKRLKDKVTRFNVGSRKQIGERLVSLGWKPKEFTENGQAKIDETTLQDCHLKEGKIIAEYLTLQKISGFLSSWIKNIGSDGHIHARYISCGTITNRMTCYNPNLQQIPSVKSTYGKECRELFKPHEGMVMVGADLSGIELRCLAHYMKDDKYTQELLSGDIHTANQKAAKLPSRANAKTFIYAFLYGAGDDKIGKIVGKGAGAGRNLKKNFLAAIPSLAQFLNKVKKISKNGYVPALDGRRIRVRSEHSAPNMLLQGAGAIIAKQWIVETFKLMRQHNITFVLNAVVHDEIQASVPPEQAELAGELMVKAAKLAGETLGFRIPVDAEYSVGKSWLETH
jgi:DNA polymerase-1